MNSEEKIEQNQENSAKIDENQQKIAELEEKVASLNDKLLRALADADNTRRRSREEIDKASKYAVSGFVSDLVVVAENFFLACDNLPQEKMEECPKTKNFVEATLMTKKELMKILEKNNVKRIYPLNEAFDHHFHEAVAHIDSELESGKVAQVIQAGYTIADRLIRPALVAVAK